MGVPDKTTLAWHVNFTNTDAGHRSVTLWPQSEIAVTSVKNGGHHRNDYFIIDNVNSGASGLVPYTGTNGLFTTVPYGGTITLWFAATVPLGSHVDIIDFDNNQPFQAFFSLTGVFGDGKLYGETIPYPSGIINNAHAQLSTTVGPTGTVVTLTCGGPCNYKLSQSAMIGWIDGSGTMTPLKTFATDNNGNIPPNTTFTIPAATPGYYTVMVTDFVNTYFVTFQHT